MSGYPQQDSSKLQYPTQQAMMGAGMLPQQGYGSLSQPQQPSQQQQQSQQPQQQQPQRVSQHYPQAGHSMYPGAPVVQPQSATAQAGYGSYAPSMQQHSSRSAQHVYNQHQLDQSAYGQHMSGGQVPTSLHQMSTPQQQPPGQLPQHPPQQSHLPIPGQTPQSQQQLHASQLQPVQQQQQSTQQQPSHGGQPSHPQGHPQQHPGLTGLGQQSQQQSSLLPNQHPGMVHSQPSGGGLMHGSSGLGAGMTQPQASQQPGSHHSTSSLGGHQMSHGALPSMPGYGTSGPQQQSYLPNATKQQPQQHGSSPQYRAPFPQLSPQMSPRPPQMSPHTQMSPRPVMSPAKPPGSVASQTPQTTLPTSMSPHPHMATSGGNIQSPRSQQSMPVTKLTTASSSGPVNTLQALEQMVMPPSAAAAGMSYVSTNDPFVSLFG